MAPISRAISSNAAECGFTSAAFAATDAGIDVVLGGIQIPRMNSIMERWIRACRRELLDRT